MGRGASSFPDPEQFNDAERGASFVPSETQSVVEISHSITQRLTVLANTSLIPPGFAVPVHDAKAVHLAGHLRFTVLQYQQRLLTG